MDNKVRNWSLILNLGLIAVIILMKSCSPSGINNKPVFAKSDTNFVKPKVADTSFKHPTVIYQPVYNTKYLPGKEIEVKGDVIYVAAKKLDNLDTIRAITEFFQQKDYNDTLRAGEVVVALKERIGENKILNREFEIKNSRKTVIQDLNPPRTKLFAGATLGTNLKSFVLAPSLLLETKKDQIFGLAYDIPNQVPMISLYWKIKLK